MNDWFFPIKKVAQEDHNGCAIACVATVCGITYERARSEFFPRRRMFEDDESLWVGGVQMTRVIRKLGFRVVPTRNFKELECPTILAFAWSPGYRDSNCHSIVWDHVTQQFIDPDPMAVSGESLKHYHDLWKRSGFNALAITGKRH